MCLKRCKVCNIAKNFVFAQTQFFNLGGSMKKNLIKFIPFFIMASFLVTGCNQGTSSTTTAAKPAMSTKAQAPKGLVYKGKVVGKSNKAKSISIAVGKGKKAKTIMVKFDDKTKGVEHASKGHASIIFYEMRDGQPWATVVKPKLAKLPKGVSEIKTAEIKSLIDAKTDFLLIDARPGKRYAASHMPGAISIGTKAYKDKAATALPKDKNKLIVTYCGGPT
jgi:rhodanese-like protein